MFLGLSVSRYALMNVYINTCVCVFKKTYTHVFVQDWKMMKEVISHKLILGTIDFFIDTVGAASAGGDESGSGARGSGYKVFKLKHFDDEGARGSNCQCTVAVNRICLPDLCQVRM